MKRLEKKQWIICGVLLACLMGIAVLAFWGEAFLQKESEGEEKAKEGLQIEASSDGGFYEEAVLLKLRARGAEKIYYTLDGSLPTAENKEAYLYDTDSSIYLECGEREQVYHIKASAYGKNGEAGPVFSSAYIIGREAKERYEMPVLSVSGDPQELFGRREGIFTLENGNRELRGREYEREVQISLFDKKGNLVLNQKGGLRIAGAYSRNKNQPSFRLYARREYDEERNHFEYPFFDNQFNGENALISKFKRILVRNSGDDNGFSYVRSELATRLSLEAGFPDAPCSSPVCVYINGEYFGPYWFVTNYDDWYFERKYGAYDGQMVILEGEVSLVQGEEDKISRELAEEYNQLHQMGAYEDLNREGNWKRLNEKMDVENFLQYMAIQNYTCNGDVLTNNFKTYRYYSPKGEYQENTVFDGRYRFLLYDMDETFNFGKTSAVEILSAEKRMTEEDYYNDLFRNLMTRPEAREYYIRYYLSLANYYFAGKQSVPLLEQMHQSHDRELEYLYNSTDLLKGNINMPEEADYSHALDQVKRIKSFLLERPEYARMDLTAAFGLKKEYTLEIINKNEASLSVDFARLHEKEYEGTYFAEVPVTVTASPKCGFRFDCFLVNGETVEEESIVISQEMIRNGRVTIECVTFPDEGEGLYITGIKSRGNNDFIELTNWGQEKVNLRDYRLSDSVEGEEGHSASLPPLLLEPEESIIVYCKDYTGAEAIGQPGINFNLKKGEKLSLYGKSGELLSEVTIPELGNKEGVYKKNRYTGEFYEMLP